MILTSAKRTAGVSHLHYLFNRFRQHSHYYYILNVDIYELYNPLCFLYLFELSPCVRELTVCVEFDSYLVAICGGSLCFRGRYFVLLLRAKMIRIDFFEFDILRFHRFLQTHRKITRKTILITR